MQGTIIQRTIQIDGIPLHYSLERKNVKNLNLHVRKDGSVYVSANNAVPDEKIDEFLISKGNFIRNAQQKFMEQEQYKPLPKQYVSGETFYIQGRSLRLKVTQASKDKIYSDGVYLFLKLKACIFGGIALCAPPPASKDISFYLPKKCLSANLI